MRARLPAAFLVSTSSPHFGRGDRLVAVLAACAALVVSCGDAPVEDPVPQCGLVALDPADGAEVSWRSSVTVTLDETDTEAHVEVLDADGVKIAGFNVNEGAVIRFTPESPLAPDTTWTLKVHACDGVFSSTFSTSSVGRPVSTPSSLEDATFALDLSDGTLREPAGAEAVLGVLLTSFPLLAGVRSVGEGTVEMIGAVGVGDPRVQDPCSRTIDMPTFVFENPWFSVDMRSFAIPYEDGEIEVLSATLSGTFSADGQEIEELAFKGTLDTRPLVPVFDDSADAPASAVCDLLSSGYGVSCVDCPGTAGPYCVDLDIAGARGARIDGTISPRTLDDIDAEACAEVER